MAQKKLPRTATRTGNFFILVTSLKLNDGADLEVVGLTAVVEQTVTVVEV